MKPISMLFTPLRLRDVEIRNRIAVSPMCQYSSKDGFATDWHLVHLGSRAVGGAGLVMVEATAVEPHGRISPGDMGLWSDDHIDPLARIARFVRDQGAVPAIQLAHAGRKASVDAPWRGGKLIAEGSGGWTPVAPSPIPFGPGFAVPQALDVAGIGHILDCWASAARRALDAGFDVLEVHAAHGYLIHEFLSPLSNHRTDQYGGCFDNRMRFLGEVLGRVRSVWPERLPLFLRISASDWVDGGWTLNDSIELARVAARLGVDLVDCSSGGLVPDARIHFKPGYQIPFAERIRHDAEIPTAAVGLITEPLQADAVITNGRADLVMLARGFIRDPYWPIHASIALGAAPSVPSQYLRAFV